MEQSECGDMCTVFVWALCLHVYVSMYICVCVCACVCMCACVPVCACVCVINGTLYSLCVFSVCAGLYTYVYVCVCGMCVICVCMCVCGMCVVCVWYVCVCVCVCVCVEEDIYMNLVINYREPNLAAKDQLFRLHSLLLLSPCLSLSDPMVSEHIAQVRRHMVSFDIHNIGGRRGDY